jgi:hypothetical protein
VIEKDGHILAKETAPLLHYGIGQGSKLTTAEPLKSTDDNNYKMRIFVRPSIGYKVKILPLMSRKTQVHWVNGDDTVKVLKEMMYEWTGISIRHQKIVFSGEQLEDHKTLSEYNIQRDSTLSVLRIREAGKIGLVGLAGSRRRAMNELELNHFGFVLGKIVEAFCQHNLPHELVHGDWDLSYNWRVRYLFERWRDHMVFAGVLTPEDLTVRSAQLLKLISRNID